MAAIDEKAMGGPLSSQTLSRRLVLKLLATGASAALLAACGGAETASSGSPAGSGTAASSAAKASSTTASSSATPKLGGTLKVLAGGSRITLPMGYDPALTAGARGPSLMFEGLTQIQDDFTIAPALAESWDISSDGKTYTFKIRKGVKFHNGRELVAADVKYSLERLLDPKTLAPSRTVYAPIATVEATDQNTAVVTLKQAYAPLLALLADTPAGIVPKEAVDKGGFGLAPVGTGAFKFVSHVIDKQMILEKNPDYWVKGLPRLDRLEVTDVLDLQADFLRFQSGQFDAFQEGPEDQFDVVKAKYPVITSAGTNWVYLRLNPDRVPLFKDVRVRQAMSWAIDRQELASFSLPASLVRANGGSGELVAWAAPQQPWVYPNKDLAKAKQLLQDAGVPSGFKFEIQTMASVAYLPKSIQVVQQQLNAIGIMPTLTVLDRAPATSQLPLIDAYLGGSPGAYDPDIDLTSWFEKGGSSNPYNFADDQLSGLLSQARSTLDQAKRGDLYRQAQTRAAQVSNALFMYNNFKFDVTQPYVKNWLYPAPAIHRWPEAKQIWLDK